MLSGEDPYLGYTMVQPVIKGIQSKGVVANAKHWVNNNQETNRGDVSGGELLSWYLRQFLEGAQAWLFAGSHGQVIRKRRHRELADYFSGTWAGKAKPYNDALKTCVQRPQFFPGESAAERNVPRQPLAL